MSENEENVLRPTKGKWVMHWKSYPQNMLALLIEAHANGWKSNDMDKTDAHSLKVRLQKMTACIREQDGVSEPLSSASDVIQWSVAANPDGTAYNVIGARRKPRKAAVDASAPQSAKTALEAILSTSTGIG